MGGDEQRLQRILGSATLVLAAAAVIGLLALGGRTLSAGYTLHVDFATVENVKEGAKVQVSGREIGKVLAVRHGGARAGEPALRPGTRVRITLWLQRRFQHEVRRGAQVLVTSAGVIGERHVEVLPPPGEPGPVANENEALRGIDPPKLDRLMARAFAQLRLMASLGRELAPELRRLQTTQKSVDQKLGALLGEDRGEALNKRLNTLAEDAETLTRTLAQVTEGGALPARIQKTALAIITPRRAEQLDDLTQRAEAQVNRAETLLNTFGQSEKQALQKAQKNLQAAAKTAKKTAQTLQTLRQKVERGEGTAARLLQDPEIIDEVKALHRLLKEHPLKAVGKPAK